MYVVIVQSLVIVWLSIWSVENYLNNIYVRTYADGVLLAYGWIMALVAVGGSLGCAWTLVHRRHVTIGSNVKPTLTGTKGSASTLKSRGVSSVMVSKVAPKVGPALISQTPQLSVREAAPTSTPSNLSAAANPSPESDPRSSTELHPAVAALKADLSERRVSLGLMSATFSQQMSQNQVPRTEEQPRAAPDTQTPSIPVLAVQKAQPATASMPPQSQSAPRPTQPLPFMRPPQSQPVRPMQPLPFGRPVQRNIPSNTSQPSLPPRPTQLAISEKFEEAAQRAGFQTPPAPALTNARNVTTVITGIVPSQKKKDDPQSSKDQKTAQQ